MLCGLQDRRGFIWFGTTEGLQRYDGRSFRTFTVENGALRDHKIGNMAEDKDGRLWLQYGSGEEALLSAGRRIDLLDIYTCQVRTLARSFGVALPFPADDLKWFFTDEQHNLFLITAGNAVWWYKGHDAFRQLIAGFGRYRFYPHGSLYQARGGNIWLSSDTELVRLDTFGHVTTVANPAGLTINDVFQIGEDGNCVGMTAPGRMEGVRNKPVPPVMVHISGSGYAGRTDNAFLDPVRHPDEKAYLIEYRADVRTHGVITHNPRIGLQLVTDTGIIQLIDTATLALEAPLSPYAYFTDQSGGHWLCSSLGVFRFQISPAYFTNYLTRAQMPAATAVAAQVRSISDDGQGSVYVARDGLYRFTDNMRRFTRISDRPVIALLCEGDSVWYSHPATAARYSPQGGESRLLPCSNSSRHTIWTYYRNRDGRLLAGGSRFIGYVSGDSVIALGAFGNDSLSGTCYQFFADDGGQTWAVTDDGLFEVGRDGYKRYEDNRRILPSRRLQYIHHTSDGTWWLSTGGDGLIRWNRKAGSVRRFGTSDGLPSNVIYACFPDARGLLWLSSNNGLIRFNPESGSVETFTRKDGLPDNEFNRVSYGRSPDGRLYFGSLNGVSAFYPDAIPVKPTGTYRPPLQVLSLQQYDATKGRLVDKMAGFMEQGSIVMEPDDRFLTMEVVLLDYTPGAHHYEYRVAGVDATWRSSGDGMIRLDNLPYGGYTLCIRGQNAQGIQQDRELRIPLTVIAPVYRKPWFIISGLLLAGLLVALGIRARVRILARANMRLEETVVRRTQELRDSLAQKDVLMKEIHHRVKNNLQMISALQQMQASRSTDPGVKAALEESQNRVLSIAFIHHNLYQHDDLKGVQIVSFVEELVKHVSEVFSRPGVHIEVVREIADIFLDIDTAVPLGLIINELLTNAYKYAFAGRESGAIRLSVRPDGTNAYEMNFSDNGVGLPDGLHILTAKSLGLRLIAQLSRQLGGTMLYERKEGSHFRLVFKNYEARNSI